MECAFSVERQHRASCAIIRIPGTPNREGLLHSLSRPGEDNIASRSEFDRLSTRLLPTEGRCTLSSSAKPGLANVCGFDSLDLFFDGG